MVLVMQEVRVMTVMVAVMVTDESVGNCGICDFHTSDGCSFERSGGGGDGYSSGDSS